MENEITLRITASRGVLKIAAKNQGEVSIKDIQLKLLWAYCWWQGFPLMETFMELLDNVLKIAIYDVFPHNELLIDYLLQTNDLLEESSLITISFNEIYADQTEVELIGDFLVLEGPDDRGSLSRLTSFRRKSEENVRKTL
ncbi:MAG: hypothetical protein U1C19_10385 [Methanobacteriaceae archaeon]|nr:hypothetical protein [Methanobacteriaceae archaeon]